MMNNKDVKRGRLRRVTIHPMRDEDGNVTGHRVSAEHEADRSAMPMPKDGGPMPYMPDPPDIETANGSTETPEGAAAVAKAHLDDDGKRFARKGAKKPEAAMDDEPMRAALGRKR